MQSQSVTATVTHCQTVDRWSHDHHQHVYELGTPKASRTARVSFCTGMCVACVWAAVSWQTCCMSVSQAEIAPFLSGPACFPTILCMIAPSRIPPGHLAGSRSAPPQHFGFGQRPFPHETMHTITGHAHTSLSLAHNPCNLPPPRRRHAAGLRHPRALARPPAPTQTTELTQSATLSTARLPPPDPAASSGADGGRANAQRPHVHHLLAAEPGQGGARRLPRHQGYTRARSLGGHAGRSPGVRGPVRGGPPLPAEPPSIGVADARGHDADHRPGCALIRAPDRWGIQGCARQRCGFLQNRSWNWAAGLLCVCSLFGAPKAPVPCAMPVAIREIARSRNGPAWSQAGIRGIVRSVCEVAGAAVGGRLPTHALQQWTGSPFERAVVGYGY
jgi:hypothetical protein